MTPTALRELPVAETFWYIGSPYSKYAAGLDQAWRDVSVVAGRLIEAGHKVYCPIAHTHPIATHAGIDPYSHAIWLPVDEPFMRLASGLVIVKMPGWADSYGICQEITVFAEAKKPIHMLEWPL